MCFGLKSDLESFGKINEVGSIYGNVATGCFVVLIIASADPFEIVMMTWTDDDHAFGSAFGEDRIGDIGGEATVDVARMRSDDRFGGDLEDRFGSGLCV